MYLAKFFDVRKINNIYVIYALLKFCSTLKLLAEKFCLMKFGLQQF